MLQMIHCTNWIFFFFISLGSDQQATIAFIYFFRIGLGKELLNEFRHHREDVGPTNHVTPPKICKMIPVCCLSLPAKTNPARSTCSIGLWFSSSGEVLYPMCGYELLVQWRSFILIWALNLPKLFLFVCFVLFFVICNMGLFLISHLIHPVVERRFAATDMRVL